MNSTKLRDAMICWILDNPDQNKIKVKPENANLLKQLIDWQLMAIHRIKLSSISETEAFIWRNVEDAPEYWQMSEEELERTIVGYKAKPKKTQDLFGFLE